MDEIPLFHETSRVGRIERRGSNDIVFSYDNAWLLHPQAFPISMTMPLSHNAVSGEILIPWLANLLPEGEQIQTIGRKLGASTGDVLALLLQLGVDTAGALSIGRPANRQLPHSAPIGNEVDLERVINEIPKRPFLVGEEGVSMSLAGAQSKLPVIVNERGLSIPLNGFPSTHILKPDNDRLEGSVQNEAFSMVLARLSGLRSAGVTTGRAGARSYLLVTRYDREWSSGSLRRLHQEDFCQALGRWPAQKYEHNQTGGRGPGVSDLLGAARKYLPPLDVLSMLDATVFNVLITNTDAHAKNYSILIGGRGLSLAPLYDLMVADAWNGLTRNMAQDIGGQRRGEHVQARHWERMARESGFSPKLLLKRVASLAVKVEANIPAALEQVQSMPAGGHFMLDLFADAVRKRVKTVLVNLDRHDPEPKPDVNLTSLGGRPSA
jgi:serine/threonine-protein kinase HipA